MTSVPQLRLLGPLNRVFGRAADWLVLGIVSPLVVLQHVDVRRVLLAAILIEVPIQLDVYMWYHPEIELYNGIGGFNLSLSTGFLAALYVLWAFDLFRRRSRLDPSRLWSIAPMLLFLLAFGASWAGAYDRQLALFDFGLVSQAILLAVYLAASIETISDVVFVLSCIAFGVVVQSLLMIGLAVVGNSYTVATVLMRIDPGGRIGGTVGSPNSAGAYLSLLIPFCLALATTPVDRRTRRLAIAAGVLGPIALVLTRSRGGWIAFGVGVVLLMAYGAASHRALFRKLLPVLTLGGCLMLPFAGLILDRLMLDDGGSAESRLPLMALATTISLDHPLLGIGPNNFVPIMLRYATVEYAGVWLRVVHNKFLLTFSELGILGLVLFLVALGSTVWRGFRLGRLGHMIMSPVAVALSAGLVGHMVHMTVDIFNNRPQTTFVWLFVGLMAAMSKLKLSPGQNAPRAPRSPRYTGGSNGFN
jgi:hypothetical protein